jgi:hypothetical protein
MGPAALLKDSSMEKHQEQRSKDMMMLYISLTIYSISARCSYGHVCCAVCVLYTPARRCLPDNNHNQKKGRRTKSDEKRRGGRREKSICMTDFSGCSTPSSADELYRSRKMYSCCCCCCPVPPFERNQLSPKPS